MAERDDRWAGGEPPEESPARFGGAGEAMHAVSRLLRSVRDAGGPAAVAETLVREARRFFRVKRAILLSVAELEGRIEVTALSPVGRPREGFIPLTELAPLADLLRSREPTMSLGGDRATELGLLLGGDREVRTVLMLPMRMRESVSQVLVLTDMAEREFSEEDLEVARAFAAAAAAGLAQLQAASDHAAQMARQGALARAAKTLGESLDLNRVLVRICEEAARILDGDYAAVYLGNATEALRIEAAYGLPPEVVGARIATGEGLAGKSVERNEPMLTNDYQALSRQVRHPYFADARSALAVPMTWNGELRGALSVGYTKPYLVTHEHLSLLEAFADLAAVACRNASEHADVTHAARTDSLTGCINHAALHDTLHRELERCRRTGNSLALAIVDLDDFKQVNERQGHLAGDEVLRRVGHALRQAVRTYDLVARYGGDEFAIVAIDADEPTAAEVASRAIEGVLRAVQGVDQTDGATGATAGVAEWQSGEGPTALIGRADQALLYGKQQGARGVAVAASQVPENFVPAGRERVAPALADPELGLWAERAREQTDRLREFSRQLELTRAVASRVAGLTDVEQIADAAAEEIDKAYGYLLTAILRSRKDGYLESMSVRGAAAERMENGRWSQPVDAGLLGRCIRERRPVIATDVRTEPDYRLVPFMIDVRSELCVPVMVGGEVWGAIDLEETQLGVFDPDEARLFQTLADQIGSALMAARLHERLERAKAATAEALVAAGEARGGAEPDAGLEEDALAVGARLGMTDSDLKALGLGIRFHDLGKIALSDEILQKPGQLTPEERRAMERYPVAGERILSPFDFLEEVRGVVRHEHERWDGQGYPDGLAGEAIPLGSRVIHAAVAYHAMLAPRPYREALRPEQARAELRHNAGAQFDPRVVRELIAWLEEKEAAQAADSDSSSARQSRSTLAS